MIAPELKNPFIKHVLDDTITLPPGDVPGLHADVLSRCKEVIAQARQARQSSSLSVVGEAGSGKSHLITQLRPQVEADANATLACVRLFGAFAGRLWRHLRKQLLDELLRPYRDPSHGANGLLRILRNRFPKWGSAATGASGGLLEWLVGKPQPGGGLQSHLEEFAGGCELDYGLQKVLPKLGVETLRALAHKWLYGAQLNSEDLNKLGLPPANPSEQEQEANAREVVLSLLRLAGDQTVLALCFDEVEAILTSVGDTDALKQYAQLATDLLAQPGPRAVITFIRPTLLVEMRKVVDVSYVQKVFQVYTSIPPLSWEQTVQIARSRLDAEPACRVARQLHVSDLDWPLGRPFLERTYQDNRRCLTPRQLILACRAEFDRLQKGYDPPPGDPWEEILRLWERLRTKFIQEVQGIQFDAGMAIGLPWLVQLMQLPYERSQIDRHLGDVNLVFLPKRQGQKALGISFCNHQPRSLWRRLDRLLSQWEAVKGKVLGRLVVLRSAAEPTTEASQSRLDVLRRAGVEVLLAEGQPLAEFAAFQGILTAALEGNLTRFGKPVEPAEYDTWARENLSGVVKEFLQSVFNSLPAWSGPKRKRAAAVAAAN
jgi:hypothetical protein